MTLAKVQPEVQGDFQRYPFPRLLFFLLKKEFSGWMELTNTGRYDGNIYFLQGLPTYTDLPSSADVLGRVLLEWGIISEEAFNQSLQELATGEALQGQILLRIGALDQEGLIAGLTLQLQRKLSRLFTLDEASFAIFSGEHPHGESGDTRLVRVDPLRVIFQGVRNAFTLERMQPELDKLQGLDLSLRKGYEPLLPRYGMSEEEQGVIPLLTRGSHSLPQLLEISPLGPLATQMLIYTLWVTEALSTSPSARSARSEPQPTDASEIPVIAMPPPEEPPHPLITLPPEDTPHPLITPPPLEINDFTSFPKLNTGTGIPAIPLRRTPSKAANPVVDPEAIKKQTALITKTHKRMQGQNHFEVLELDRTASLDQVRSAYFQLAKVYHPDRCAALGLVDLTSQAEEIFRLINEANSTLSDPTSRKAYEEELDSDGDARSALQAEIAFQKGVVLMRKKGFAAALKAFNEACQLNDTEGEHHGWAAWALFRDPQSDREKILPQVQKQLERAIELAPKSAQCHYFLGEVLLALGNEKRARSCFEKTVKIQDWHIEANRHLHIMQIRKEKAAKPGGLFDRLRKR